MINKKLLLLSVGLLMTTQMIFSQVPSYVPSNGLVGYWGFNGNANDQTPNSNNGTVNGASLTTDRFGNSNSAYSFDGVNDYINANIGSLNTVTFSFWFNSSIPTSDWLNFFGYNQIYCQIVGLGTFPNNFGKIYGRKQLASEAFGVLSTLVPQYDKWHHIILEYDSTNMNIKLYIDGQFNMDGITSTDGLFNSSLINDILTIGASSDLDSAQFYKGNIDDIAIYNRALTQQEITNMYNGVNYSDTCNAVSGSLVNGLVGYWPFCGNANDQSGNGNNGTVNGATLTTDRFGNANSAYLFTNNGIVQNIQTNYAGVLGQNNRTISLWYKQDVISTTDQQVLCGYAGVTTATSFAPTTLSGRIGLDVNNTYRHYSLSISNEWNHAVFVYETGNSISSVKVYLNGVLQTTAALTFGNQNTLLNTIAGINFRINASNLQQMFIGSIDDIGIWNRALSPTEVSQLYNQNQCFTNTTVTDTLIINVGQLSYTNPIAYSNNITIAPNPASTQININFNNISDLNGGSIKIINSLGQQVATTPITTSGTNTTMSLDTWGGTGLYFVQILNTQGIVVDVKKIILQ
jgi:hypothetical protein